MNFLKKYKIPLAAVMGLIAVFFIFQNGTCNNNRVATSTNSLGGGGGATPARLSAIPSVVSVAPGGTIQIMGTGGTPPYRYNMSFGSGSINNGTGMYTAPASPSTEAVIITDAAGNQAYASITVENQVGSALYLNAAAQTVVGNSTVQFTARGGTPPYQYYVISGGGQIDRNSGMFTAPQYEATVEVKVSDALSQYATKTIQVTNGTAAFSSVTTNSQMQPTNTWNAAFAIDNNTSSCYSSLGGTVPMPSVKPYLMFEVGPSNITSMFPVSKIAMRARIVNSAILAFPASYTIKAMKQDGSWQVIGTYTNQPDFDGVARIEFSQTYMTKKLAIIANTLTKDDHGYYYFQVCDVKLY